jgi:hypothetical protein
MIYRALAGSPYLYIQSPLLKLRTWDLCAIIVFYLLVKNLNIEAYKTYFLIKSKLRIAICCIVFWKNAWDMQKKVHGYMTRAVAVLGDRYMRASSPKQSPVDNLLNLFSLISS